MTVEQGIREQIAADLARAEASAVAIDRPTDAHPDLDVVDAYEIQLINIRQKVAEGARVIGHKVGLSSEAMQKMMNVDEPDYGHLLDGMEVFEDRSVESARFLYPRVEVEVGFILSDDLPGAGCTEDDVLAATAAFAPARALAACGLARSRSQNGMMPTTSSAAGRKIATVARVTPHSQCTPCAEAPKNDANVNSGPGTAWAAPYPARKVSASTSPGATVACSKRGSTTCPPPKTSAPER